MCLSLDNRVRQYRFGCFATCCDCRTEWSRIKIGGEMSIRWSDPNEKYEQHITYKKLKEKWAKQKA